MLPQNLPNLLRSGISNMTPLALTSLNQMVLSNAPSKWSKTLQSVYLAPLSFNKTPRKDGTLPAFKLFHRQPCTTLPVINSNSKPLRPSANKLYTNPTHGRDLPEIAPGTTVRIRTDREKSWEQKGVVVKRREEPRCYNVLNSKGNIVHRNHRHLLLLLLSYNLLYNLLCDRNQNPTLNPHKMNLPFQLNSRRQYLDKKFSNLLVLPNMSLSETFWMINFINIIC